MMRPLLAVLLAALPLRAGEAPEVAVAGIACVRVAPLWDAPALKEVRATFETRTPFLRERLLKQCLIAPGAIERVTIVQFNVGVGDGERQVEPLIVLVPRQPLDAAAIVKESSGKVKLERGKWAALPEFTLVEVSGRARWNLLAVSAGAIVLLPSIEGDDARATQAAMIAKALPRDAELAASLGRKGHLASLSLDVIEMRRLLAGDGGRAAMALAPLANARVLTLTANFSTSPSLTGEAAYRDAEAATVGLGALETGLKRLQRLLDENGDDADPALAPLGNFAQAFLHSARVEAKGRSVHFQASRELGPTAAAALALAATKAEAATVKAVSCENLRLLSNAVQHNSVGSGAPMLENIADEKGRALLSWRVKLLPSLGFEDLYAKFKLDEPWDSTANRKLIAQMPKVYRLPGVKTAVEGRTFYQAFVGRKGAKARPLFEDGDAEGMKMNSITDGVAFTFLAVEAAEAVEWSKPQDLAFDLDAAMPKLGGHFPGGFHAAFCDGSVRFLKDTLHEQMLKAYVTANGDEDVGIDD